MVRPITQSNSAWRAVARALDVLRRLQEGPARPDELTALLSDGRPLSPTAARYRLHRAIARLRDLGFAVAVERRGGTRYRLAAPAFRLSLPSEEREALAWLRAHLPSGLPHVAEAQRLLDRLVEHLPDEQRRAVRRLSGPTLDLGVTLHDDLGPHAVTTRRLNTAIRQNQAVTLRYRLPGAKEERVYRLEPLGLRLEGGHLYLRAHDRTAGQTYHRLRVDRIVPESCEILPALLPDRPAPRLTPLRLRLAPALAAYGIAPRFPEQRLVAHLPDGAVELSAAYEDEFGAIQTLLRYGDLIEVLAPAALRAELARIAGGLARLYGVDPAATP